MQKCNIGIVGLGGIGGLLAVLFENKKYKILSSKKSSKKLITLNLKSNFFGNLSATIDVSNNLKDANIIFICSKYQFLKKHLKKIDNKNALIIPLLNGLSHYEILKKKFKNNIFFANIGKVVSKTDKNYQILHGSNNAPEILISSEKKNKNDLKIIIKKLNKINIKVKIKSKNSDVVWSKLIRLSAISAITALYNCNLGQIKKSQFKMKLLKKLIKEALIISKKSDDYKDNYKNTMTLIKTFPNNLTTSLQRDINNGVNSELETQIGSIVKLAKRHKISSSLYKKIYLLLKKKCQKKS